MSFEFRFLERFNRSVKKLKKRFPQLAKDLEKEFERLEANPQMGVVIPDDYGIRKLRVASSDMQRGKSGGFRVLYKLSSEDAQDNLIATMLFVYTKVDQEDVSTELLELLNEEEDNEEDS
jgi:mRNA-degrading endonuclease RelE of RelBE toxin-antitoxin system